MTQETWQAIHIAIGVLTGAAAALLAMMFWNSSVTNRHPFTTAFLKLLSIMTAAKVVEIAGTMYRGGQIDPDAVPVVAAVIGLSGRAVELTLYLIMIWFLLRPETKRALNGATSPPTGS